MTPLDFERLPDSALQGLVDLLNQAEVVATWPWQALLVARRPPGKKSGGERVIGLLSMLARARSQAREHEVKQWADESATARGSAAPGNSALREGAPRGAAMRMSCGHAMLDAKDFYDSMCWVKLGEAALRPGPPPGPLGLELQQCLAPRVIIRDGMSSLAFQPAQPIVQGSRSGARFARCLTYFIMKAVVAAPPSDHVAATLD